MTPPRLARALLAQAARLPPDLAAGSPALAAIDEFVARPSPARYLRAARLLGETARAARAARLDAAVAGRSFEQGLARLRASPVLDRARRVDLAAYPVDPRAGRRLSALALLLEAHQELAARVRRLDDERSRLLRSTRAESRERAPRRARPRRRAGD